MPVAVLRAVTLAFCTTAPLESVTMPCIAAVVTWQTANGELAETRKPLRAIELNARNADRIRKKRIIALQNPVKWGNTLSRKTSTTCARRFRARYKQDQTASQ